MEKERPTELLPGQGQSLLSDWAAADVVWRWYDHRTSARSCPATTVCEYLLATASEPVSREEGIQRRFRGRSPQPSRARTMLDERWVSLLECAGDLVVVVDADGLILHVNHAPARLTTDPEGVVGRSIHDFLAPEYRVGMHESIESVLRTGGTARQVVCFSAPGGAVSRSEACMGPITENGRTVAVGVFFTDAAERERLETRLRESEMLLRSIVKAMPKMMDIFEGLVRYGANVTEPGRREQELELYREHMVRIGRFVSVGKASSHLTQRLPQFLTAIGLSVENALAGLEASSCRESVRQELEAALGAVSALGKGVELVRGFAETGARRALVHAVNLRPILVKTVQLLETRVRQANTPICIDDLGELAPVRMAEGDAEQLFFSLLENIIRLAARGEHTRIAVSGAVIDHTVELQFSGCCDPCERENPNGLQDLLFAAKPAAITADLGLHVASDIVARAGGRIRSEHAPGGRLTFFVVLPTVGQVGLAVE